MFNGFIRFQVDSVLDCACGIVRYSVLYGEFDSVYVRYTFKAHNGFKTVLNLFLPLRYVLYGGHRLSDVILAPTVLAGECLEFGNVRLQIMQIPPYLRIVDAVGVALGCNALSDRFCIPTAHPFEGVLYGLLVYGNLEEHAV